MVCVWVRMFVCVRDGICACIGCEDSELLLVCVGGGAGGGWEEGRSGASLKRVGAVRQGTQ